MDGISLADCYSAEEDNEHTYDHVHRLGQPVLRNVSFQEPNRLDRERTITNISLASWSQIMTNQQQAKHKQVFLKAYKNLKIQLGILLTANLIVLAIFIWTCLFMNADVKKPTVISSYVRNPKGPNLKDNFRLCTKCERLLNSYGGIDDVIREIRMEENRRICCFKRIGQMLDLFEKYASWYVDSNYKIGPCSANMSTEKQLELLSMNKPLIHAWYRKPTGDISEKAIDRLNWFTEVEKQNSRHFNFSNGSKFIIPFDGDYYIYCSVKFNGTAFSSKYHYLEYQESPNKDNITILNGVSSNDDTVVTSQFQGTFRLKKNSIITVFGKESSIIKKDSYKVNYFGMYLV